MAPPPQRECLWPGCAYGEDGAKYKTSPNLLTIEQVHVEMHDHMEMHKVLANTGGALRTGPEPSRVPKAVAPKVEMDITDQDWKYFEGRWARYKSYCRLTEERDLIHNMWECLSEPLMKAAT